MRRRKAYGALGLILVVTALVVWSRLGPSPGPPPVLPPAPLPIDTRELPYELTGAVVTVVDGDTIDVELNGSTVRVHYIGVTTPETMHPTKAKSPVAPKRPRPTGRWSRARPSAWSSMSNSGIAISGCWPTCTWATS